MSDRPAFEEMPVPAASGGTGSDAARNARLGVFVSYSRDDVAFADQLVAALDVAGVSTTLDRTGIHGAEDWQKRLYQMILESDAIVFVLTPASADSPVCRWEIDQAVELKKRIVPVLASPLGASSPHEYLQSLNYILFYTDRDAPNSGFGTGLGRLVAALSVNVEWIREHTRLGTLAALWRARNRPVDLLLRGSELTRLQQWRDARPVNAPELTLPQREFLQQSEEAETARVNEEHRQLGERQRTLKQAEDAQAQRAQALKQLSRRTKLGLIGIAILAGISIAGAATMYRQRLILQRSELRLREGMTLKIADTDHLVTATEKWYRIATDYKLAIGLCSVRSQSGAEAFGTGFLVKGEGLRSEWAGRVVFVTALHVLAGLDEQKPDPSRARITFPGIDATTQLGAKSILFQSAPLDVAVVELAGMPPRHAMPVDIVTQIASKQTLDGVAVLHWTAGERFSIGFGHGLTKPAFMEEKPNRLYYTYVTGGGASGAPVFDASSGGLVCLHVAAGNPFLRPHVAECTSISAILSAIAAESPRP